MHYCLDTNVVVDMLRGDVETINKLDQIFGMGAHFCTNPVILYELFKGAFLSEKKQENLLTIEEFSQSTESLEWKEGVSKLLGESYAELKKKGKPTQEIDLMIGCIALAHDATLITRNPKDFVNIKGLKVLAI